MIEQVGKLTDSEPRAQKISSKIKADFAAFSPKKFEKKAAYLIWRKPNMVAAGGTFIDEMMKKAGFSNVFGKKTRYPEISDAELVEAAPDFVLLSSEPYPFAEKHIFFFKNLLPSAEILLVDGEIFSWYGSRLLHATEYFRKMNF
jgi:ABC-type Fe3+-hydroxamate transport system substrate-binding protein